MAAFMKHPVVNFGENNIVTMASKVDEKYHRSHIIIHGTNGFYFGEFNTPKQLYEFLKLTGCKVMFREMKKAPWGGTLYIGVLNRLASDEHSFWACTVPTLPKDKQSVKLLSNGSIVDGYFWNDGKTLHIYRPNPNDKEIYKPLSIADHIAWHKAHGSF